MNCQLVLVLVMVSVGMCYVSAYVPSPNPSGHEAELFQQLQTALNLKDEVISVKREQHNACSY